MTGLTNIQAILATMSPELSHAEFVFCSVSGSIADYVSLDPVATLVEREGLTLILEASRARFAGLTYEQVFRRITLQVHSSLEAVGLTAVVSTKLAEHGISANMMAGYYHDHIFVKSADAETALTVLCELSKS